MTIHRFPLVWSGALGLLISGIFVAHAENSDPRAGEFRATTGVPARGSSAASPSNFSSRVSNVKRGHDGAWLLSGIVTEYRLNKQFEEALKGAMDRAEQELTGTGAPGVLFVARYERDKNAELYSEHAPPNTTKRLIGDRLEFVRTGSSPKNALAMKFDEPTIERGVREREGFEMLPASEAFWISKDPDSSFKITELDYPSLAQEARQIYIDSALFASLRQSERRLALGDGLDALEQQT